MLKRCHVDATNVHAKSVVWESSLAGTVAINERSTVLEKFSLFGNYLKLRSAFVLDYGLLWQQTLR